MIKFITVEYHNGEVLNNSDRNLKAIIGEGNSKILHVTPIITNSSTTSIQYIIDYYQADFLPTPFMGIYNNILKCLKKNTKTS